MREGKELPSGAVLVAKSILHSSLWTKPLPERVLALYFICKAFWKPGYDKGRPVERGQFYDSIRNIAKSNGIAYSTTNRAISNLIKDGFMDQKRISGSFLFTIPNYNKYQDFTQYRKFRNDESGSESGSVNEISDPPASGISTREAPHLHQRSATASLVDQTDPPEKRPLIQKQYKQETGDKHTDSDQKPKDIVEDIQALMDTQTSVPITGDFQVFLKMAKHRKIKGSAFQFRDFIPGWIASHGPKHVNDVLLREDIDGASIYDLDRQFFKKEFKTEAPKKSNYRDAKAGKLTPEETGKTFDEYFKGDPMDRVVDLTGRVFRKSNGEYKLDKKETKEEQDFIKNQKQGG